MTFIANTIHRCLPYRWSATVIMVLLLDVSTYMAFKESSGQMLFPHQDKLMHLLGFMVLTTIGHLSLHWDVWPTLARRVSTKKQRPSYLLTCLNWALWISYGVFIEAVQKLLSYRGASIEDFLADVAGIIAGTFLVFALKLYPRSAETP